LVIKQIGGRDVGLLWLSKEIKVPRQDHCQAKFLTTNQVAKPKF
jgi:hypothetical protein